MSRNYDVSIRAATLARIRAAALAMNVTMGHLIDEATADIGGDFMWRGLARESKPPAPMTAYRRRRARMQQGGRYTVWVAPAVHARISAIANRRGLSMAEALDLITRPA